MDYTQLFRQLREAKGITLEELARQARVHRNTIFNLESGRSVKFKTVARLMRKLGYADSSPEMKSLALLWLEAVSGLPFSRTDAEVAARKTIVGYRAGVRKSTSTLSQVVTDANLTPAQIETLIFAAQHSDVLAIIENVRAFATSFADARDNAALELLAAEDEGNPYQKS
ncbi:MAG TPA: helix-turn-helix transcriptional regulator [Opitutus sp.]|nr:helix-turn-helix transcriptional regulator [Opitutus sp.]